MKFPQGVVLLDSLGNLQPNNSNPILVCGSHCGGNRDLARHVNNCHVKVAFLNDAGIGKNRAGIRGLTHYEAENVLACAVDRNSAEIGIANDTWESGIISHATIEALDAGIRIGDTVQEAVAKMGTLFKSTLSTQESRSTISIFNEEKTENSKVELKKQFLTYINEMPVTVTDSITFLNKNNADEVVVCGSHGGLSAGHYAQKHGVKAVFFNDAGIGKNNAGVKSLDTLQNTGILACTVDCMSAEIFNGKDALENGIVSVCNQLATEKQIKPKMTVKEAIRMLI